MKFKWYVTEKIRSIFIFSSNPDFECLNIKNWSTGEKVLISGFKWQKEFLIQSQENVNILNAFSTSHENKKSFLLLELRRRQISVNIPIPSTV
jgi:hypothetical protein